MSHEYPRRGRNWFTAMGLLFIIMAVIVWSPEFVYDFLVGPDITNEKVSVAMIVFGCFMIGMGFRKSNVKK